MYNDITIIICCAGMGTRLGIGTTKTLVNVAGKTLIQRQLELMNDVKDVRIVVGFQAENVIKHVNAIRKDVLFAFNHDFQTTGEADSLSKALVGLKKYTILVDGDLLINKEDFNNLLKYPSECIGITELNSDEPIYAKTSNKTVVELNETTGDYEYSCIAKIKSIKLKKWKGSLYSLLNQLLPIRAMKIRSRDIDTPDDYDRMIEWFKKGCED